MVKLHPDSEYDRVARLLANEHKSMDPDRRIFLFPDPQRREIRLIEATPNTPPTGEVFFFRFAPAGDVTLPLVVAEVTEDEWALIDEEELSLPEGWDVSSRREL